MTRLSTSYPLAPEAVQCPSCGAERVAMECPLCEGDGGGYRPNHLDDGAWDCPRCAGEGWLPYCLECGEFGDGGPSSYDREPDL